MEFQQTWKQLKDLKIFTDFQNIKNQLNKQLGTAISGVFLKGWKNFVWSGVAILGQIKKCSDCDADTFNAWESRFERKTVCKTTSNEIGRKTPGWKPNMIPFYVGYRTPFLQYTKLVNAEPIKFHFAPQNYHQLRIKEKCIELKATCPSDRVQSSCW